MAGQHYKGAPWGGTPAKAGGRGGPRLPDGLPFRPPKGAFGAEDDFFGAHRGQEALIAAQYQQRQMLPGLQPGYHPQSVMYPVWLRPFPVQPGYGHPGFWQPPPPPAGLRGWSASPPAKQQAGAGTGVFLPSRGSGSSADCGDRPCSESDGDSAESTSECLMLEEQPIRRGQISSSTPIEQLLPEEWEY